MITFVDGAAGRRARVAGGPDVWELVAALRSARAAEPRLSAEKVLELVVANTGTTLRILRAAISYWSAFPDEIDAWIAQNDADADSHRAQWKREQGLLSA